MKKFYIYLKIFEKKIKNLNYLVAFYKNKIEKKVAFVLN
jgi:hypothetical protein